MTGLGPLAISILLVAVTVGQTSTQNGELVRAASDLAARIAALAPGTTVGVVDFTDLQGRKTELGRSLSEELSVALVNTSKGLRIIDRANIRELLAEQKLAQQGVIDERTAAQLGKIAGLRVVITGIVRTETSDTARVTLKAVDTQTAETLAAAALTMPISMASRLDRDLLDPPRVSNAAPNVRPFQNAFLTMTADSATFSASSGPAEASVNLSFVIESRTSAEELLLCVEKNLVDDRGTDWTLVKGTSLAALAEGYNVTYSSSGGNTFDLAAHTRLPPGVRETVFMRFNGDRSQSRPATVDLSMKCYRRRGNVDEPFSITISRIPIGGTAPGRPVVFCGACGQSNLDRLRSCAFCGAPLSATSELASAATIVGLASGARESSGSRAASIRSSLSRAFDLTSDALE
ncbi:MAG TPA: FlgO family outer membrane protein [Vicinamibacterales bacterium]|nr:FlgO family outer membrane protein [Vicinamibacterales bacterium]